MLSEAHFSEHHFEALTKLCCSGWNETASRLGVKETARKMDATARWQRSGQGLRKEDHRLGKLDRGATWRGTYRARPRLYRNRLLQQDAHWNGESSLKKKWGKGTYMKMGKTLAEIYLRPCLLKMDLHNTFRSADPISLFSLVQC